MFDYRGVRSYSRELRITDTIIMVYKLDKEFPMENITLIQNFKLVPYLLSKFGINFASWILQGHGNLLGTL